MESNLTAVEWLEKETLLTLKIFNKDTEEYDMPKWLSELLKKAKEMEKSQIIDAVTFGQNNHTVMISADLEIAEQYFEDKFNK
jgi:hypothetical protein